MDGSLQTPNPIFYHRNTLLVGSFGCNRWHLSVVTTLLHAIQDGAFLGVAPNDATACVLIMEKFGGLVDRGLPGTGLLDCGCLYVEPQV